MKIRIKRKLLNESKLDSYSNVWKRWETIDDFNEWNRTQVLALAKHRKGQGRFDFKLYDKVYEDLKSYIQAIPRPEDSEVKFLEGADEGNIFWNLLSSSEKSIVRRLVNKHKLKVPWNLPKAHIYASKEEVINYLNQLEEKSELDNNWVLLRLYLNGDKTRQKYVPGEGYQEVGIYEPVYRYYANVEPLKQILKNMESLKKDYPWNKKHLGNIQRHLGIYEKKVKKH